MDPVLSLRISRLLSYSVVAISFFMKLPQVLAILFSGNTRGLNLRTNWMEIGTYLIGFSYGYTHQYHISIYGEAGLLAIQSATIIFLVLYYEHKWTYENVLYIFASLAFMATCFLRLMPHSVLSLLLSMTLPLGAASKLAQISMIYQIKSKGNVSTLTWSLAAYGCFARLFTVYVEVGGLQLLLNFFVSFVLNTVVVIMCLYYGNGVQNKH